MFVITIEKLFPRLFIPGKVVTYIFTVFFYIFIPMERSGKAIFP